MTSNYTLITDLLPAGSGSEQQCFIKSNSNLHGGKNRTLEAGFDLWKLMD